ncbi:hypothetical protein [Bradyrhizobium sp. CCBAU 51627]|uniref:hypothetical protein n=1 Tax=Bradyrhizobium sp. CCBAU 51627 TaxID=1325088 RepID=UPI002306A7BF|nr:hypothetical protein [Bradyrhizobium sp. CCBAU 51627]MDA9437121.1 hypothetical protein [Bradyrhizobium sp. CCBAU 51627]
MALTTDALIESNNCMLPMAPTCVTLSSCAAAFRSLLVCAVMRQVYRISRSNSVLVSIFICLIDWTTACRLRLTERERPGLYWPR